MSEGFSLTPKQAKVLKQLGGPQRHFLAYGGSRSGKTYLLCYAVAVRAMAAPGSRHLIARLHNVDVNQAVLMDTWPRMMGAAFPGVSYHTNRSGQYVTLPGASEVWFGGLDDKERADKILGKEFATIYSNEASQISYNTILTLRTRLAQVCTKVNGEPLIQRMYYDLNPVGRAHWSYREFVEGVRPENGTPIASGSRAYAIMNPTDNPHLDQAYLDELAAMPERQRQRFYEGRYLTEVPGALWPLDEIEALRVDEAPELSRIVVAIDPSGSDGTGGDSQGIVAVGLGPDGHAYVLEDASCRLPPNGWAMRAVQTYHRFGADKLVAEANYGGAMVESTVRTADPSVNYGAVNAARGKHIRAEPVAALYAQGKVHHVRRHNGVAVNFAALEEQMGMMTSRGYEGGASPDRLDALVWALTELMLKDVVPPFVWHVGSEAFSA